MRPVVLALSRPCRVPHATLMNPGLRKALARAMFSRPVGAPMQRFRSLSEDVGKGQSPGPLLPQPAVESVTASRARFASTPPLRFTFAPKCCGMTLLLLGRRTLRSTGYESPPRAIRSHLGEADFTPSQSDFVPSHSKLFDVVPSHFFCDRLPRLASRLAAESGSRLQQSLAAPVGLWFTPSTQDPPGPCGRLRGAWASTFRGIPDRRRWRCSVRARLAAS